MLLVLLGFYGKFKIRGLILINETIVQYIYILVEFSKEFYCCHSETESFCWDGRPHATNLDLSRIAFKFCSLIGRITREKFKIRGLFYPRPFPEKKTSKCVYLSEVLYHKFEHRD